MSQDYTVAKELASLKEIKQSAEQRISELSLNALNYVNDHRLHKAGGGGSGKTIPDEFGLMIFVHSEKVPVPEWGNEGKNYYLAEYITKDFNYVRSRVNKDSTIIVAFGNTSNVVAAVVAIDTFDQVDGAYRISSDSQDNTIFLPSGEIYFATGGK